MRCLITILFLLQFNYLYAIVCEKITSFTKDLSQQIYKAQTEKKVT